MSVTHDRTHAAVPGAAGDASEPGTAGIGGRGTIAGDAGTAESTGTGRSAGIAKSAEIAGDADIAPVAALIADGARAAMLTALLDGRALAAGELARIAGVSAPTASSHLARLLDGGLVTVVKQGRHRYYRLAGPDVARTLEVLARISGRVAVRSLRQSRQARLLREARSCYDHLAGRVGVELYDALVREGGLIEADGGCLLTASGAQALTELGVDVERVRRARRRFAPDCLDWLERRPHLGGALGAAVLDRLLAREWLVRGTVPRALRLTGTGREGLERIFGCKDLN
ncbi:ArsR/SmtB family transcription factor [Microbispora bryophytorum]|uniref:Helix-turn-helix transcriptional regulator n=1 Tax=Microbispora bryophytorum subsp. camponoti TaxID=1677852 RepID=A0ABR8L8L3_9ACTN|nr:helix-turn-helix domain-containing protein [Microbispora camponoti]MBD3147262.1 helix-turn-helix transcriptional regulator [Microbispora camponoti]